MCITKPSFAAIDQPFLKYGHLMAFKMAAVHHLGFIIRVCTSHDEYLVVFIIQQKFG